MTGNNTIDASNSIVINWITDPEEKAYIGVYPEGCSSPLFDSEAPAQQLNGNDLDLDKSYDPESKLHLQGRLTNDDIPVRRDYYINHDVMIDTGVTLTIPPGTRFFFMGNYSLDVYGTLIAQGAVDDTIEFRAHPGVDEWQGIQLNETGITGSDFDYCVISNCVTAITSNELTVNVTHSLIHDVNTGIYLDEVNLNMYYSKIYARDYGVKNNHQTLGNHDIHIDDCSIIGIPGAQVTSVGVDIMGIDEMPYTFRLTW